MKAPGFILFDTVIGHCGIAWSDGCVLGTQLPERDAEATRARLEQRFPTARETRPPVAVRRAITDMVALLRGEARDLSNVVLDLERVSPFHRRVFEVARTIPPGATLSYGELATRAGAPAAARAVGQALGRNPFPIIVPCHRVLAANGKVGGFTADGGTNTKLRMLAIEGAGTSGARSSATAGLTFDLERAVGYLCATDTTLAQLIAAVGPCRIELRPTASIFAALAEAIVYQQLNGKAAATIYERVCALFPRAPAGPSPARILRTADEPLRAAGLSRNKLLALRDLAKKSASGEIPTLTALERMADETIIEHLTAVRGIGRWTVEMLLMFRLGRPDVLPVDDYGVRKGYAVAFRKRAMPAPKDLARYGQRWAPYRTVASWYLWRAAEQDKA